MSTFFYDAAMLPTVTLIGKDDTIAAHRNIRRVSEDYIFYFIRSGTIRFAEGEREYTLHKGDTFLFEPGLLQYGIEDSQYTLYYLHFQHPCICKDHPQFDQSVPIAKQMHFENEQHFLKLCQAFERILEQHRTVFDHVSVLESCAADEFFIELARRGAFHQSRIGRCSDVGYTHIHEVIDYLNRHYRSPLNSETIEKDLSYNFDYLNQLFRRHLGSTIFQTLEKIRMENAQNLLLTSDMTMAQIAKEVGYREESYFSKVFKKATGLAPSVYRNNRVKMD